MSDRAEAPLNCAVAWATPGFQFCVELQLPAGSTVADACAAARLRLSADSAGGTPQPPWDDLDCGIFGQHCDANRSLRDGDRVELYRPLPVNPRDSRRNRVQVARRGRKGG